VLFTIHGTYRIVRDIELRYTKDGTAVATTAIVSSRKWKDKSSGELMEETSFLDIVIFGDKAEKFNEFFSKGSLVEIDGFLQHDKWTDNNGNKRSKHVLRVREFDFGPCKKSEGSSGYTPKSPNERGEPVKRREEPKIPEINIDEDDGNEIPF